MTEKSKSLPRFSVEGNEVSETLRKFVEASTDSFSSEVDQVVRVEVGRSMNVLAVEFTHPGLDRDVKQRLEAATVAAVNSALQKAALAAGNAMAELEKKIRTRSEAKGRR
jgi:DNA-binding protein YbaB